MACPCLHHLASRRQMYGMVVGRLHRVAFSVGQLPLDDVRQPPTFVQHGRRHAAKIVRRDHRSVVAESAQCSVHGVLVHRLAVRSNAWGNPTAVTGEGLQVAQGADC